MNRKEYRDAMEQIKLESPKKETLWEQISQEIDKPLNKHSKKLRTGIAAAVILLTCLLIIPGNTLADEVKEFFMGFLKNEKAVEQFVEENIYEDSDEHLKIQITELVSDEVVILATVKYDALDETGKEWLKAENMNETSAGSDRLNPDITPDYQGNTWKYGVNVSYGHTEITEYRTDTSRVYLLTCEAENWSPSMKKCEFVYDLTDGDKRTVSLDTSANVPVYEYKLKAKSSDVLSSYYEPTHIRLSKLSYVIYGKQKGLFETVYNENIHLYSSRTLLNETENEEEGIIALSFQKQDGTCILLEPEGWLGEISSETIRLGDGYDCCIVNGTMQNIYNRAIWKTENEKAEDPRELTSVTLTKNGKITKENSNNETRKHLSVKYDFLEIN